MKLPTIVAEGILQVETRHLMQGLMNPAIYPDRPSTINFLQTQMSLIFLTGEYVYKIKKPVDLGYLDYTTLDKRRYFCHQELKLNNRLSSGIYLEVVPLTEKDGQIALGGEGTVIEYAVKMRQLPPDRMMNVLLQQNGVSEVMLRDVAAKLAAFHTEAETNVDIGSFGRLDSIRVNTDENFSQTRKYIGLSLSGEQYSQIKAYTEDFMKARAPLFEERIKQQKIRDCHGDLHCAHVCFTNGVCIYDCIEFNDRFRYCDVASEIAFLAMDLDYHRRPDLSQLFVASYVNFSGDRDLPEMLGFYQCYRAYVRGKVESFKLDDAMIPEEDKPLILASAKRYFEMACAYTRTDHKNL